MIFVGIYIGLSVKNTEAAGNLLASTFPLGHGVIGVRTTGLHARLARDHRRVEPGLLNRHRDPRPLRVRNVAQHYWILDHALAAAIVWPTIITVVFLPLAVRQYQRLSR